MIKLELTKQEAHALAGLLHAGVQHIGLPAAKDAAILAEKLDAAVRDDPGFGVERLRDGARSSAA